MIFDITRNLAGFLANQPRLRTAVLIVGCTLLLGGCAKGPAPNLYMLDQPFFAEMAGIEKGIAVGVGPIELPQYLDRPQIITRDGVNRLYASDAHVWAEPIKNSASRVLAVTIAAELDSNRVYVLPRRVRTALDWRVEIDVGRFDSNIKGNVLLAARWTLFRGMESDLAASQVSIIEESADGHNYNDMVSAQSRALQRLGHEIATLIKASTQ